MTGGGPAANDSSIDESDEEEPLRGVPSKPAPKFNEGSIWTPFIKSALRDLDFIFFDVGVCV